jgi:hypothetical protein
MSATLMAAAGRASLTPPPAPRTDRINPALTNKCTNLWTVVIGTPVSADRVAALIRGSPQWRAAALMTTTA